MGFKKPPLRSRGHLLHLHKRLIHSRNCKHNQGNQRFTSEVGAIVGQRVHRRAHAGSIRVRREEDESRQESEEITAQNTGDIALDQAVLFIAEQAGQAQSQKPADNQ